MSKRENHNKFKTIGKFLLKYRIILFVAAIFLFSIFLHTFEFGLKNPFGYDQVDNAWAAKDLIINDKFPIVGMVAKANSGIYIGPLYYYIVTFFYFIFNLNPIASLVISLISSLISFWIIYYVAKKIFSSQVAIIALLLNTFNFATVIYLDGVQWPVQLIPVISLLIFYLLYRVILGEYKKIIFLAIAVGFSFHLHFTAIFFPIIILLSLPLFPRNKEALKYMLLSIPIFLLWLLPNIYYSFIVKGYGSNAQSYLSNNYHGFHLTRMIQIIGDALIQFNPYLVFDRLKELKIFILPLFLIAYYFKSFNKDGKKLLYLIFLWFMVPWLIFTVYKGEISDYYFFINRYIALLILSYLVYLVWSLKFALSKILVIVFISIYSLYAVSNLLPYREPDNLFKREKEAKQAVDSSRRIEFTQGDPASYLYYYYMREKGVEVYESKEK